MLKLKNYNTQSMINRNLQKRRVAKMKKIFPFQLNNGLTNIWASKKLLYLRLE